MDNLDPRATGTLLRAGHKPTIAKVRKAFNDADGSLRDAAQALGVAESTLHVWVKLPCFESLKRRSRADAYRNLGLEDE